MKNGLCRVYNSETDSYPCKNEWISPDCDGPFGFCETHAESLADHLESLVTELRNTVKQYRMDKGV